MKCSDEGIELIKRFEAYRGGPYRCPAGKATIGFGSTFYADGTPVTMDDPFITEDEATDLLQQTLGKYEKAVNDAVEVELTQGQFDALVDFAYNAGTKALKTSTLLRKLNGGDFDGAANEFAKWVRGGGRVLPGLIARRKAEQEIFNA